MRRFSQSLFDSFSYGFIDFKIFSWKLDENSQNLQNDEKQYRCRCGKVIEESPNNITECKIHFWQCPINQYKIAN